MASDNLQFFLPRAPSACAKHFAPGRSPASIHCTICILPHARARERVVPISELVFGTLTQNRSSLEPSLGFAAIAGTPRIVDRAQQLANTASHPAPLNRSATISTRTAVSIARPQNDGLAEAGSNEAKSVSCHSGPERGFQPDRAGLGVLQGWRRSELLASQVLYEA